MIKSSKPFNPQSHRAEKALAEHSPADQQALANGFRSSEEQGAYLDARLSGLTHDQAEDRLTDLRMSSRFPVGEYFEDLATGKAAARAGVAQARAAARQNPDVADAYNDIAQARATLANSQSLDDTEAALENLRRTAF